MVCEVLTNTYKMCYNKLIMAEKYNNDNSAVVVQHIPLCPDENSGIRSTFIRVSTQQLERVASAKDKHIPDANGGL